MEGIVKKVMVFVVFFSIASKLFAPTSPTIPIIISQPEKPFTKLINAIGMVETALDTLAYNKEEEAAGFFQIRPIRVTDYNKRTGSHLSPRDMFNYEIAEKVFLYYASQIGPFDFEKIAKNWNGSGPMTITYWNRVKRYL